ncbi:MAG: M42 family peptidase [Clostridia bacterium]|nr:M42 family peptidase [Clostridia bacterium]
MKDLVKKLSEMRGVSLFEYSFSEEVKGFLKAYSDDCFTDSLGNVVAVKKCGRENPLKVMIEGHIDEIGLMVSGIDEKGFISFVSVGGIDSRILPGSEVVIHGKRDITGVIGAKPPHLQADGEDKKALKSEEMYIDTGYEFDELSELVRIGTPVTFSQSVGEMKDGTISYKALDDRAGVAVIADVLRRIEKSALEADVYAVATVQEEVGLRGAKTAANLIKPHISISIDVCHGVTPDNSNDAYDCGCGTVISKGPNIHPALGRRLIDTAVKHKIPFEIDVDGGYTGTNAWAIQIAGTGVATALLSLPLKYMHNPVETMKLSDLQATSDLIVRFLEELEADWEEWLCL